MGRHEAKQVLETKKCEDNEGNNQLQLRVKLTQIKMTLALRRASAQKFSVSVRLAPSAVPPAMPQNGLNGNLTPSDYRSLPRFGCGSRESHHRKAPL